jgi:hypothetical protein
MNPNSKYFDCIRIYRDPARSEPEDGPRCQWENCDRAGTHRAPVGRLREGEYYRFCVDHVREYNRSYNYFSGLAEQEIHRFQKEALTGHRPTWAMASNADCVAASPNLAGLRSGTAGYFRRIGDPFGLFGEMRSQPTARRQPRTLEVKSLETLGLKPNATGAEIRTRYKELVKRHHPDTNGGNRGSEERFREVIQAYRLLRKAGFC